MQQQLTAMQQQQAAMQQQQAAMQQQQAAMQQQLSQLMHRTSCAVATARLINSHATQPGHSLAPLPHPDTGAVPPSFPATVEALRQLSAQASTALINFYNLGATAPAALPARRKFIGHHIGCLSV